MTMFNSPDDAPGNPASPTRLSNPFTTWLVGLGVTLLLVGGFFISTSTMDTPPSFLPQSMWAYLGFGLCGWGVSLLMFGILIAAIDWIVTHRR